MKDLAKHIEASLLYHNCVIVPNLGGFVTHYIPAKFEEEENLFFPPVRTVGFNPQLTINDSLLAQSYAEAYDISIPEATERIEKAVNSIKKQLDNTGKYQMHGVGILSINSEGKTEFTPNSAGILSPRLYALDSFKIKPIRTEGTTLQESGIVEGKEETAEVINMASAPKTITIRVSALRNAVVAAIALLAIVLFTNPIGTEKQEKLMSGGIQNMLPKSITFGKPNVSNSLETPSTNVKKVKDEKPVEPQVADEPIYCIVLASGTMRKNAEPFTEILHKNGFQEARLFQDKNDLKVIYGKYQTQNEAYTALKQLRNNEYFKQGWVKKIEHL